jgi:hypothetical protein
MGTCTLPLRIFVAVLTAVMLTAFPLSTSASAATCTAVSYNGQSYCPATISGVKATAYGLGARVVLQGVSVTAKTATTVTVEGLEATPCPAGSFCGATMTQQRLTVAWRGGSRPGVGSVIDLYATTTSGSLRPVGYLVNRTACYIDLC